ncbi:flagellar hook-length control protein FliK [Enterovibrio sp. 27052020O]|uniref:flagellar hook-length control protein FliK n=1 Tax=Enterovibrio sp. 27052020O TaxID=3241166 RepID=UPI00388F7E17
MKIDNVSNISALTLESLKNKLQGELLQVGQEKTSTSSPTQPVSSQIAQFLRLLNLFPLLLHSSPSATVGKSNEPSPLGALLKALVIPNTPELAAKWLAERHADKALLEALKFAASGADSEGGGKLKALLMLLTEQRVLDGNKANEYHWYFPLSQLLPTPVHITAKNKTRGKRKKSLWSVTINLTLSKNRQLSATAELDGKSLALHFSTDSPSVEQLLEQTIPALEKQLSKHDICVSHCEIRVTEDSQPTLLTSGVNIQV